MSRIERMSGIHIAALLPAYNVAREIEGVLQALPPFVETIIVVNDGSVDDTGAIAERYAQEDDRVTVLHHETNRGVGGAMLTGFEAAMEAGAQIIVKIDADGQMPLQLLPQLIAPLVRGDADYTKGNRFRDFREVRSMPLARRVGNVAVSFLAKAATGYWNVFDATNGFLAIRSDVAAQLPLHRIDRSYFFEISLLSHLYLLGAVVKEVPMPARYAGETSSLSIARVLRQFPGRLLAAFARRVLLRHFVYDFNLASLHLALGLPLFAGGVLFGAWKWFQYAALLHEAAPTGTVVLPAVLVIVGMQLLLSAAHYDLAAVPEEPVNSGPLGEGTPAGVARGARRDSGSGARRGAASREAGSPYGGDRRAE